MNDDGGTLPNLPEGWVWATINQISLFNQYGYTESASNEQVGPKFLRITDIQNGNVDWNNVPYCQISDNDKNKYLLHTGDILFARTGATTGKSFLIGECPETVFASYLIRLKLPKNMDNNYVYKYFQSLGYWKQISSDSKGTGQPGMNATILGTLQIPLPPLLEQYRIVAKIEELFALADEIEQSVIKGIKRADYLEQSILAKAFRGELVPQDPNDEPANVLLERIKAERGKMNKLKRGKK